MRSVQWRDVYWLYYVEQWNNLTSTMDYTTVVQVASSLEFVHENVFGLHREPMLVDVGKLRILKRGLCRHLGRTWPS